MKYGEIKMGDKNKNKELWVCKYCGYKSDKETLIEQQYMFELKNKITVCECPHCDCQQEV